MSLQKDSQNRDVVPIFIDGNALPIKEDSVHPVHSSLYDKTIHHYASTNLPTCDLACEAAWTAFSKWKNASAITRRDIINCAADLFEERKSELVKAQIDETSCAEGWAINNVSTSIGYMREIAACVSNIAGTIPTIDKANTFAFVFKEPVGPVLVIPPWNGALVLAARAATSAIGAGCCVVLKGSELCPLTHSLIVEIYHQAGLPRGVLNSLSAERERAGKVTERLIANERIRKVEFIGSAEVGRAIGAMAAKYLKPVLMELGGKCPAIVLDDADLEQAATLCARGALLHHGQICFSTERIIVLKTVAEQFIDLLIKTVAGEECGMAVHSGIASKAQSILQDAEDKGAEFLIGDTEMAAKNSLKPSIVLIDPKTSKEDMRIIDEETFSPSASLYIVEDDAEAIQLANSSSYGLNATIHSSDMERAIRMGRELEYGQVHVNSSTIFTSWTGPQGGVKSSGWGRQNARWGLEEYLQDKFITYHGKQ